MRKEPGHRGAEQRTGSSGFRLLLLGYRNCKGSWALEALLAGCMCVERAGELKLRLAFARVAGSAIRAAERAAGEREAALLSP